MKVFHEWWHLCLRTQRIRRLYFAGACQRCGVWHYLYAPDRAA